MKDFLNYCLYPALGAGIVGILTWAFSKCLKGKTNAPSSKPVVVAHLSDFERRILTILAEGGHAAVAFDENNEIFQVNMYGHPEQDTVAPVAAETRTACRTLLRRGLITEIINGKQNEYAITDKGRLVAANLPDQVLRETNM